MGLGEEFDEQGEHLIAVLTGESEGELGAEQAVVEIEIVAAALELVGQVALATGGFRQSCLQIGLSVG
mgnify:CR=1 FL=1